MEFLAHLFSNDHFMNWSNQSKYFRASFTTWSTKSRSSSPATTGQVKLDVTCLHSQHTFCPRIVSFCIQSWMYCTTAESKFIDGFPVMDLKDWWTNKSRHVKLNWTGPNWVWPASILKGLFVQGLLASTFDHWLYYCWVQIYKRVYHHGLDGGLMDKQIFPSVVEIMKLKPENLLAVEPLYNTARSATLHKGWYETLAI